MKLRCIANTGDLLPESALDVRRGISRSTKYPVTVGAEYVVYAVTTLLGHCWYYIFDDDRAPYPIWRPAALFDLVDGSLPGSWIFGYIRPDKGEEYFVLSFPEWVNDSSYYERLVEGDPVAVEVFSHRRGEAE